MKFPRKPQQFFRRNIIRPSVKFQRALQCNSFPQFHRNGVDFKTRQLYKINFPRWWRKWLWTAEKLRNGKVNFRQLKFKLYWLLSEHPFSWLEFSTCYILFQVKRRNEANSLLPKDRCLAWRKIGFCILLDCILLLFV